MRSLLVCAALSAGALLVGCSAQAPDAANAEGADEAVGTRPEAATTLVQLFDWKFRDIERELDVLKQIGVTHVHVSPPTAHAKADPSTPGPKDPWYMRYQPIGYSIGDDWLGTEADFTAMVAKARQVGVGIVVDVVLNHVATPHSLAPNAIACWGAVKARRTFIRITGKRRQTERPTKTISRRTRTARPTGAAAPCA